MKTKAIILAIIGVCFFVGAAPGKSHSIGTETTKACNRLVHSKGIKSGASNYDAEMSKCFDNPNNYN
jgi:hypothetical protein